MSPWLFQIMTAPHLAPYEGGDSKTPGGITGARGIRHAVMLYAYLLRPTTAELLQAAGLRTAIAGSKGVALLQDRRERTAGRALTIATVAACLHHGVSRGLVTNRTAHASTNNF